MAIALDAASSTSAMSANPVIFSHTVSGADRFLIVGASWANGSSVTVTGVTYDSVAMTLIDEESNLDSFGSPLGASLWGLIGPNTGTHDVSITFDSGGPAPALCGASSWTGVHQTTPLGTAAKATGDGTTPTVNVTSAANEVVVDVMVGYLSSGTPGTGQTADWNLDSLSVTGAGSHEAGAGTVTMSWTIGGGFTDNWRIVAVPLKPAAAAATTSFPHSFQNNLGNLMMR